MEAVLKWIIVLKIVTFSRVSAETYAVRIETSRHVNVVDPKFLSFTVDPKYLFLSDDKFNSKECSCMATALAPAFIRIAGPFTEHMTLSNSTITLQHPISNQMVEADDEGLSVTHAQWKDFASWTKKTGFELVFALNNNEKTTSGLWDPNTAISILTVAEKADLQDIFWQLGYECKNQSIEEYLTDLQTLRVIVDTFPPLNWKVVGGDIAPCLQTQSKSDFKDYVTLSNEMLDAVLLDGNSSSYELDHMSERDRQRLLSTLSHSSVPLWIADQTLGSNSELVRAANWMHSLGQAARNGFSVHFRELVEHELYQPTMSFYMALLFKNLVGERVLSLEFDSPSEKTSMFAHCTSLRHKQVPSAVTLFGANLDEESARFSLKLGKKEDGGDIMQFILGLDVSGNIIVNGRAMYYEGDIKPVVRRVRPYKTLLLNLPPKSFGFWVLANTNTKACQEIKTEETDKAPENNEIEDLGEETRFKRSLEVDFEDSSHVEEQDTSAALLERIDNINKDLKNIHKLRRYERVTENDVYDSKREKRQVQEDKKSMLSKWNLKSKSTVAPELKETKTVFKVAKIGEKPKLSFSSRLAQINARLNTTRQLRKERAQKLLARNKVTKRHSKLSEEKPQFKFPKPLHPKQKPSTNISKIKSNELTLNKTEEVEHNRRKRSILSNKKKFDEDVKELLTENEIDLDDGKYLKLGKILHKINEQLNNKDLPDLSKENGSIEEQITVKTKISGDDASIKVSEKSSSGIFKSAFSKVLSLLEELTHKVDSILNAASVQG